MGIHGRLPGVAAFAASIFVLLFVSRVFQTSYLVWPLTASAMALVLANADDEDAGARANVSREIDGSELQPVATRS